MKEVQKRGFLVMTIICSSPLYIYKGLNIELPAWGPPQILKKSGESYQRIPVFAGKVLDEFLALSEKDQEVYRRGGGCQCLH